ncbi:hypothetical protein DPMN_067194 [Dreissena polymorpha]|uniref:Uncharacterized protein n=1 Tax=Dreissena polymorpha TaxID=45954 RepID=A0A9D4BTB9_DREPO|nr:hypothetical protein DPMN_067194 [Dreissena polymorpha]
MPLTKIRIDIDIKRTLILGEVLVIENDGFTERFNIRLRLFELHTSGRSLPVSTCTDEHKRAK